MIRFAVRVGLTMTVWVVTLGQGTVIVPTTPNNGKRSIVTSPPTSGNGKFVIRFVPTGTVTGGSGGIVFTNDSNVTVTLQVNGRAIVIPSSLDLIY
jgi:hypothetical protein